MVDRVITDAAPTVAELRARLGELSIRDEHRLRRRLQSGRGKSRFSPQQLTGIAADIDRAANRLALRTGWAPKLQYPADLPITARHDELLAAIEQNQVIVLAGETGSGKTTQLPKLCLELGRGTRGLIGHTQPRRLAARAVAQRVADELGTEVGAGVGFAVRFSDQVGESSRIKVMTDGILLAEISRDALLRNYDTIIIDEAHERSLNIDFLLGYLKTVLPRRPDLKLIITSATIDPQRFANYFHNAAFVEVSGRGYPVEVRYRPIIDPDDPEADPDRDLVSAVGDAVRELARQGPGDVLVFLSGEREIRDVADALAALNLTETEILPLYARLSAAEQHRIFAAHRGRRIVLSTNVAETSLTVPGIKYVIDAGTARISRYSNRTKVQLLPIEAISQASAAQRAGRCGRTSPGICIRLYSEDDFDARPAFTDPEILRTNLASVILQMACLDLGPVEEFGFLDPPDRRAVADGVALLTELGAFSPQPANLTAGADAGAGLTNTLTARGRALAQLPLDPRLARMVLEAQERGCVAELLVLTSALSIADPRERPLDKQQAADASHARFTDPTSDFNSLLHLWRYLREQQRELSSNQFRRMCRNEYLNYLRIREWQDLFTQLRQIVKGTDVHVGELATNPDVDQIHRSLLSGLLSQLGLKEGPRGDYLGARGAKFAIFPGSGLFKKQPAFVMAAELVETSRLWARTVAGIDALWAEELAGDLVKRTYSEPHWERRRGSAVAVERATLYGVPIVVGRKVNYGAIDPVVSRELFLRHALVEGDWETRHHFFAHNTAELARLQDLQDRARRRDLVDEETVFSFYEQRVPQSVVSARHFDQWWKKARHDSPELLNLNADDLLSANADDLSPEAFPTTWTSGDFKLDLSYRFEPGAPLDGITVTIPLPLLGDAAAAGLDWQVPGLRAELVTALLRTLPKQLRRLVVPIPDTAQALVQSLPDDLTGTTASLAEVLSDRLAALRGVTVTPTDWNLAALPDHLRPTYRVADLNGKVLQSGKDLAALQRQFRATVTQAVRAASQNIARDNIDSWDFDIIPRQVSVQLGDHQVTAYPALVEVGDKVALRVLDTEVEQRVAMRSGLSRLIFRGMKVQTRPLRDGLSAAQRLMLSQSPHGSAEAVVNDCARAATQALVIENGGAAYEGAEYDRIAEAVRVALPERTAALFRTTMSVLADAEAVRLELAQSHPPVMAPALTEIAAQLRKLIHPGFISATGATRVGDLRRYLRAMTQRLADAQVSMSRDQERQAQVDVVERDLAELRERLQAQGPFDLQPVAELAWMIEELRVSLFAQRLGTPRPVSVARIQAAMDELDPDLVTLH